LDTPRSIARAATITSIGSFSSRIIGLVRDIVKSYFFGNGQLASAFELASNLPTQFNDLLAGGMLSSALVPTFSATLTNEADRAQREALGRLVGVLVGISFVVLSVIILLLWLFAVPVARFITGGANQDIAVVSGLLQITIPAILFLNLSGIFTAVLHARRRFNITAFTAALFNLVMIGCIVLFESWLGINALALGLVAGSIAQMLLQLYGMRGIPIKLSLNWRHDGLSHILRLYMPVAAGLVLAQLGVQVSFIVASRISAEGPATMRYAAQIIQFPLGMISAAVSAAILPALSTFTATSTLVKNREISFNGTLAQGLRLVAVFIIPASIGLYILAQPVIGLLFERGAFTPQSTLYTAQALRAAIPGLLFAAIDQPLIFAFYAQRNTRTPTLVGLASNMFYFLWVGGHLWLDSAHIRAFDLYDLVLANSLKTGFDALLMAIFLLPSIQGLRGFGIAQLLAKVILASLVMGAGVYIVAQVVQSLIGQSGTMAHAVVVFSASALGGVIYLLFARVFSINELSRLYRA
jgi:putative peptidoglycan lipid II flippase